LGAGVTPPPGVTPPLEATPPLEVIPPPGATHLPGATPRLEVTPRLGVTHPPGDIRHLVGTQEDTHRDIDWGGEIMNLNESEEDNFTDALYRLEIAKIKKGKVIITNNHSSFEQNGALDLNALTLGQCLK